MNQEIVDYLNRLKNIYQTINKPSLSKDIKRIEKLIDSLDASKEKSVKNFQKPTFKENYESLINKKYVDMTGVKLDYKNFNSVEAVIEFIKDVSQSKLLRETTAVDLKLLYCILTNSSTEMKGTKNEIYEAIKRNVRARKRGEAFKKL
ncbi:hypothetical protein [Bacillus sp. FJAT-45350]|uniref:hypothetical protein n=1 Tax=Bacillus sp. FJAT-45350 TaxID=2011014 RepID=UPI000BB73A50|nr:hypothetical protein [Bacillus sp. FJAT-45350]